MDSIIVYEEQLNLDPVTVVNIPHNFFGFNKLKIQLPLKIDPDYRMRIEGYSRFDTGVMYLILSKIEDGFAFFDIPKGRYLDYDCRLHIIDKEDNTVGEYKFRLLTYKEETNNE